MFCVCCFVVYDVYLTNFDSLRMQPVFVFIISDTNLLVSTMSDNTSSRTGSWDEEEEQRAQAKIIEMTKKFLLSPDGIRYLDGQVAPQVADHI